MSIKSWVWKSAIAGLAGSIVHLAFMYAKLRLGILPSFQPYPAFQATLSHWTGADVPAIVPWLLSFLNGMTILGFLFVGPFAIRAGLGIAPALLSLGMVLTYSVVLGTVYVALDPKNR